LGPAGFATGGGTRVWVTEGCSSKIRSGML
jgi:hypothetical protein